MRVRRLKKTPAHLEITAFINLIVVLVPFLLSTAVFTRLAVIDLSLPAQSSDAIQKLDPDKPLKLEVVVRADGLDVQDKHGGLLDRIPNVPGKGPDTKALGLFIAAIKNRFPQQDDATVLAENATSYETLVRVMDAVRSGHQVQNGKQVRVDYFPSISIGDAPLLNASGGIAPATPAGRKP
ncbi:MAG TPA: biopolymer transporter ExbD [Caldimonas sp.]|jgi:biopolymer transport protein ExbD|nr:biopolymer transporter ExbD [Caldimonas sp.]HEX2540138.1 biopolymer transporter ExbD [Caldimonas sp.]